MTMMTLRRTITGMAVAAVLGTGVVWTACRQSPGHAGSEKAAQDVRYHCPMHPTYVSDKPGDCPICGMKLVPMAPMASSPSEAAAPAAGQAAPVPGRAAVTLS